MEIRKSIKPTRLISIQSISGTSTTIRKKERPPGNLLRLPVSDALRHIVFCYWSQQTYDLHLWPVLPIQDRCVKPSPVDIERIKVLYGCMEPVCYTYTTLHPLLSRRRYWIQERLLGQQKYTAYYKCSHIVLKCHLILNTCTLYNSQILPWNYYYATRWNFFSLLYVPLGQTFEHRSYPYLRAIILKIKSFFLSLCHWEAPDQKWSWLVACTQLLMWHPDRHA